VPGVTHGLVGVKQMLICVLWPVAPRDLQDSSSLEALEGGAEVEARAAQVRVNRSRACMS